ncbi:MAG: phospho-sugar mutase [Bacteroidales bacterium]|nr:phospho-sugar mutase [Bacteroidales bacterium]
MVSPEILARAKEWLSPEYDKETREAVMFMLEKDEHELLEAFHKSLEFGTGGLRGIMGVGPNRMNVYTVAMATQGLCNYLQAQFPHELERRVAIAHDSRHNSQMFAEVASKVFSANGIRVYLFDDLRPTPELSFAIRTLRCHCGVVLTASHNPKEYNGYKVYWQDGGQIVPPHDRNIIAEVQRISRIAEVNFNARPDLIQPIGRELDEVYLNAVASLSLSPDNNLKHSNLNIVYTPIHGTGIRLVPMALRRFGFAHVSLVQEQCTPDGSFPTVPSPNPEEPAAMQLALERARAIEAELVLGTDPDADRVGIGLRDAKGQLVLINGNQAAALLLYYVLSRMEERNELERGQFVVKTIVTSDLLARIAEGFGVECHEVLTGFKYIAERIAALEGRQRFVAGGEESFGYLVGDFVRDKDAVIACCMFAEAAAWAKERGMSLHDVLLEVYARFGLYRERLVSLTKRGVDGAAQIAALMARLRQSPPDQLGGSPVVRVVDYLQPSPLPKSDVLQLITALGDKVSVRPSGTEPKIKLYFSVRSGARVSPSEVDAEVEVLERRIDRMVAELGVL